jgi:hypothetical protein
MHASEYTLTLMVISLSVDLGMFRDTLICAPEASCIHGRESQSAYLLQILHVDAKL